MDQVMTNSLLISDHLECHLILQGHLHRTDCSGSLLRCSRHSERTGLSYATSMHAWRQPKKQRQLGRRDRHLPGRHAVCLVRLERLVAHGVPVVAYLVVRRPSEWHRTLLHRSSQLVCLADRLHDLQLRRGSQPRRHLVDRRVRLEHRLPCRRTIRAMVQYTPTARSQLHGRRGERSIGLCSLRIPSPVIDRRHLPNSQRHHSQVILVLLVINVRLPSCPRHYSQRTLVQRIISEPQRLPNFQHHCYQVILAPTMFKGGRRLPNSLLHRWLTILVLVSILRDRPLSHRQCLPTLVLAWILRDHRSLHRPSLLILVSLMIDLPAWRRHRALEVQHRTMTRRCSLDRHLPVDDQHRPLPIRETIRSGRSDTVPVRHRLVRGQARLCPRIPVTLRHGRSG